MEAQFSVPLNPLRPSQHYRIEEVQGCSYLVPHYAERRQPLRQPKWIFHARLQRVSIPVDGTIWMVPFWTLFALFWTLVELQELWFHLGSVMIDLFFFHLHIMMTRRVIFMFCVSLIVIHWVILVCKLGEYLFHFQIDCTNIFSNISPIYAAIFPQYWQQYLTNIGTSIAHRIQNPLRRTSEHIAIMYF